MKKLFFSLLLSLILLCGAFFYTVVRDTFALPNHIIKTPVATDLAEPTDMVIAPDKRIFILEKSGKVKVVKNGTTLPTPALSLSVNTRGERGLLGASLDRDFANNNYIYLVYISNEPLEYRVARFTVTGDILDPASELILFKTAVNAEGATHLGGGIQHGPDGKIWFTTGDNTLGEMRSSQDLTNAYGKLLRVNADGTIPSDNPFVGQNGVVEAIWAYGLRNPFRFDFKDDKPIVADVGGDFYEEVNIIEKGGNYGWPDCEGGKVGNCNNPTFKQPVFTYAHDGQSASITGGLIYTGNQLPEEYKNSYFYGDYIRGFIKRLTFNPDGTITEHSFDDQAGPIVSFKQDTEGYLYALSIYPGELYQIKYSTDNQLPTARIQASATFGDAPLSVQFDSSLSSDPEGSALNYKWDFGDSTNSTEANPTHIFTQNGKYTVRLIVNDGQTDSVADTKVVSVGDVAPEGKILFPEETRKFNGGETIFFEGTGTDREDGELTGSAFSFEIIWRSDNFSETIRTFSGQKSGTFVTKNVGRRSANQSYEIRMTVRDSAGLSKVVSRTIYPNTVKVTLNSEPQDNLITKVDGIPFAIPFTMDAIVNYRIAIDVDSPVIRGPKTYTFESWSDGGSKNHEIVVPNTDTTYTAKFKTIEDPDQKVPAFTIIAGDIKVDGTALYDNDPKTGLVVLLEQPASVTAEWGATYIPFANKESAETSLPSIVESLKSLGCGTGCSEVKVIRWPSEKPEETVITMQPGEKRTVKANSIVIGDIKVNGEILFDDAGDSGLITLMEQDSEVEAPWGARIVLFKTRAEADAAVLVESANLKDIGCGSRCMAVTVAKWPSKKPSNKIEELKFGEKKLLPKFSVISGDIKINGKDIFDSNEKTGLVVKLMEDAEVEAPWGATYNLNTDEPSAGVAAQLLEQKVKTFGCLNGCETVNVLSWPAQVVQQAQALFSQVKAYFS